MQKTSFMFLLIFIGVALIGIYNALFTLPAITVFDRFFALSALYIFCISLMIGPLVAIDNKYASLIEPRRAVGLAGFVFLAMHGFIAMNSVFKWNIGGVIGYRPVAIAVPAMLIFLAMALTSSDWAVRTFGGNWKKLQMLVYPAFALSVIHFVLQSNGLFAKKSSGAAFVNLAEVGVLLLCALVVLMQVYGFYLRRKRGAASA